MNLLHKISRFWGNFVRIAVRGGALLLLVASFFCAGPAVAQEGGAAAGTEEGEAASTAAAPAPEAVITGEFTSRSQAVLAQLDRLRSDLEALGDAEKEAREVASLKTRVDELLPEGVTPQGLSDNPAMMDGVAVRSRTITTQAESLINQLTRIAETLEKLKGENREIIAEWERVQKGDRELPEALNARVSDILTKANEIRTQIDGKLNTVIELQDASMGIRNLITPIAERIASYGKSRQTQILEKNAMPIWAITSEHISESSTRSTRQFADRLEKDFESWLDSSDGTISGHLLLLPLLLFLLFKLKSVEQTQNSALARPLATGVLVWMLMGIVIYAAAPQAVRLVFVVVAMLVATVVLLEFLPRKMRGGVLLFVAIALVHEYFQVQSAVEHLARVAYLVISAVIAGLAWVGRGQGSMKAFVDWGAPKVLIVMAVNAAILAMLVAIIANITGYVVLAKYLTQGVIDSTAVFLILFAGFSSISQIVLVVLRLPVLDNFRSISSNRYRLQWVLRKPLVWVSLFLWLWATLLAFGIDDWVIAAIQSVFQAEVSFGDVTLSLRGIIVFIFAVWVAIWASRIVRAVLNQDVLPRMDLPRGVGNTISMTAHYTIIMIGLLLGVGYMGLDLSSLAFVVGALGVGIGFGLQNVVNNFVSGLILIFEAPIQVGDTVEVGALMGRVVRIGIRTSRVRTYSGSEVIVPNGDLVSNQVINWTLSDRKRRLELNVGVAYGSDTDKVTDLLRAVLEADEDVLEDPAPLIVFSEFGDSALNFRIFAWISDFDIGMGATHRLNSAINHALAEAGITIPFPQRDLHMITPPDESTGSQTV